MLAHLLVEALDEVSDVSAEFLVEPVPLRDLRDLRRQPLDGGLRREELVGGAVRVGLGGNSIDLKNCTKKILEKGICINCMKVY